ncbi:uncharacterized protein ASCRUDRAFT_75254 [Ascoidea rubescens DSM 1968]|uniref:FHA domain-containing protein n=1 Tax=Ascoidea rubescens DSM 1968 TaxID=1344418 RepID=A0A1D2VK81_9ASCO|nr:hypothetical protein ASCRUDRAFT_75254 [Ascoidea rubescens DSM 1968]ODV62032.1 hypothetical protein ASCRUDRAFT_75254 [Ascoidea rubescens DSM 1968]
MTSSQYPPSSPIADYFPDDNDSDSQITDSDQHDIQTDDDEIMISKALYHTPKKRRYSHLPIKNSSQHSASSSSLNNEKIAGFNLPTPDPSSEIFSSHLKFNLDEKQEKVQIIINSTDTMSDSLSDNNQNTADINNITPIANQFTAQVSDKINYESPIRATNKPRLISKSQTPDNNNRSSSCERDEKDSYYNCNYNHNNNDNDNDNDSEMNNDYITNININHTTNSYSIGKQTSNDIIINNGNKYVSRNHLLIHYNSLNNSIIIDCLSLNGVSIILPYHVKLIYNDHHGNNDKNLYEFYELNNDKFSKNVNVKNINIKNIKNIKIDKKSDYKSLVKQGLTDFNRIATMIKSSIIFIIKGERVNIPCINNILLDIRGELVNINCNNYKPNKPRIINLYKTGYLDYITKTVNNSLKDEDSSDLNLMDKTDIINQIITLNKRDQYYENAMARKRFLSNSNFHKNFKNFQNDNDDNNDDSDKENINNDEENSLNMVLQQELHEIDKKLKLITLENILINHLAYTRLASTPIAFLQKNVSHLISKLDKVLLRKILNKIRCIGVIYREGKDAAGQSLDEEYYYDVEKDPDQDRKSLIKSIKGGNSLRSCRRSHKQYFWKKPPPLHSKRWEADS